jgi:lipopolysaccharide biosynthesis glycosyltransferase
VDDSVTPDLRASLAGLVKTSDRESALIFLEANRDFDQAPRGPRWPLSVYYRLMLPLLLPELDDIIYADGDIIFCRDLLELTDLDLGENLIAGVMEKAGYINSGFLVLNLARLRQDKIYEIWTDRLEQARREQCEITDQDLLNATCRGRILYLPVKFNFCHNDYFRRYNKGLIPPQEQYDLKYNAVILHYAGLPKPWSAQKHFRHRPWWEYAKLTPFYEYFLGD